MREKPHSIEELNKLYQDSDHADSEIFAEQRSNILLISGEHYTRRNSKYWNRIRDSKDLSSEQKIRLTKNHIQKITKLYLNNIISQSPSVCPMPNNEKELQDQKAAEMNKSVWQYARYKHNLKMETQNWCKDYIDIGEVVVKIFWDPNAGKFLGHEAKMGDDGQPELDDEGQMVPDKPKFSGDFVFDRIFGFNLFRDASAKSMKASTFLGVRQMVDAKTLKAMFPADDDKQKFITEGRDETFLVFDGNQQNYNKSDGQVLLKEFYFKPSVDYPMGYFFICTSGGILFEGELPFGIFPIIYEGFDEFQTTARHHSIVKVLRPYQAEINRSASKMAEHQITLGDDKVLVQSGTKVTTGVHLPGVRSIQYSGTAPTILAGRAGDQYTQYNLGQITEMYQAANLNEDAAEKNQGADLFSQLFMAIKDKKKFSIYAEKFENFLKNVCSTFLDLSRHYYPDDMLIQMVGRAEHVNMAEFKTTDELCYHIKIEPQADDFETMMGKQLVINHALQYVGSNMDKEDIGKLMRAMPFGNFDESFNDLTLDYDTATNLILALDRGDSPQPNMYDKGPYIIKRLTNRIRQKDFDLLNPQIQQNYHNIVNIYEQMEVQKQQQIMAAQAQFIPSSGARIKVDYYVPDPTNSARTVRATLPAESVDWLIKRLADQGSSQDALSQINEGALSEMAGKLNQQVGQGANNGLQAPMPPQYRGAMPVGRQM